MRATLHHADRLIARPAPAKLGATIMRTIMRMGVLGLGAALIAVAVAIDHTWIDRHVLPDLIVPLRYRVLMIDIERVMLLVAGTGLIFVVAPWFDAATERIPAGEIVRRAASIAFALIFALFGSEAIMRWITWRHDQPWRIDREPLRRPNRLYGWDNVPSRASLNTFYSPPVRYAVDADSHRVAALSQPVDYRRPTILFLGESIMFGAGLNWAETIPGRVQTTTGIQSANLAVNGFATDQAYLRLRSEIRRYERPVAIVVIFGPALMERNLRHNKPWLDRQLQWHPTEMEWRLQHLIRFLVPLHRAAKIQQAIVTTRAVLLAERAVAQARGVPLIMLVPSFPPEGPMEAGLLQSVLDGSGIRPLRVTLEPSWRIPADYHPDARADRVMAAAIVDRLKRERAQSTPPRDRENAA